MAVLLTVTLTGKINQNFTAIVRISKHENTFLKHFLFQVKSSFEAVEHDSVQAWYDDSGGLRAHYNVKPASTNQQLTINFKEMQKITLILVKSGNDEKEGRQVQLYIEYCYTVERDSAVSGY